MKLTPEEISAVASRIVDDLTVSERAMVRAIGSAVQDEVLRLNGIDGDAKVFDFTAMEKAMTLASMLAGSVVMNDVSGAIGYGNDLRRHLASYVVRPDTAATPPQQQQTCNYPDCTCPTESPCLKGLPQQQQAAPGDDSSEVWPIVNLDVAEDGTISNAKLYAPGLPAGNHDVYPVRVPYMDEHTEAWLAVSAAIEKVRPGFLLQDGKNGIECAVSAIQSLAASGARDSLLKRAEDLHEKAGMPWAEAEKLALSEAGIDDRHIDELTGNTEHATIVSLLSDEDVREFVRTVLIYGQPLLAAAPKVQETGA